MPTDQRTMFFYLAIAAAVVLALVGVMYFGGIVITSGQHTKRGLVSLALAAVAVVLAILSRPTAQPRY